MSYTRLMFFNLIFILMNLLILVMSVYSFSNWFYIPINLHIVMSVYSFSNWYIYTHKSTYSHVRIFPKWSCSGFFYTYFCIFCVSLCLDMCVLKWNPFWHSQISVSIFPIFGMFHRMMVFRMILQIYLWRIIKWWKRRNFL